MGGETNRKKVKIIMKTKDPKTRTSKIYEFEIDLVSEPDNGIVIEHAVNVSPVNFHPDLRKFLEKAGIDENDILSIKMDNDVDQNEQPNQQPKNLGFPTDGRPEYYKF